jgi:hypothetical protein
MRRRSVTWALAAFLLACIGLTGPAAAQPMPTWDPPGFQAPPDPRWAETTRTDVEAAYRLLRDNDPGGAPELHDHAFMHRLETSRTLALSRAQQVTSYDGYVAVLAGFANGMGDKHIWSRPAFVTNRPLWPGFIVSKHGSAWVVADTDDLRAPLKGAQVISCDGVPVEDLARANLGAFKADWSVGAQQFQNAPWLLVDDGNPFVKRPTACVLVQAGKSQTVHLDWELIKRELLLPRLHDAIGAGASGFGVRKVGDGYWIAMQRLMGDGPPAVLKAVEAQKEAMRQAKFVVLDLRGNGGGGQVVGDDIAISLVSKPVFDKVMGGESSDDCGQVDGLLRVSDDNLAFMKVARADFLAKGYPDIAKLLDAEIKTMEEAKAKGKPLTGDVNCKVAPPPPPATRQVASPLKGRLIVLTDNLCFSACLSVVQEFLALGAYQVGQTTDAATRFVDLREQHLPSGYSYFSVLMSVHLEIPYQMGPFVPALTYDGDIADTKALEAWITGTVVPKALATGPKAP